MYIANMALYSTRHWKKIQLDEFVQGCWIRRIVKEMRSEKRMNKKVFLKNIDTCTTLAEKCAFVRRFLSPNSTMMEQMVKRDLGIADALDNTSGDGIKNNTTYEIKCSVHDRVSTFNWRQIRPDHNIDFYILIGYNLNEGQLGRAYNFKIPSAELYSMVVDYGGYSHGSKRGQLPDITFDNMKGHLREYSLSINPNTKHKAKRQQFWDRLQQYITPYDQSYY
tara:strand:+ start:82 stop:747 length:666 start_codon:yes stop_codon:yes gene_type:complete